MNILTGAICTPATSFKTKLFRDYPFNEHFRFAAFEDMELGYRLESAGKLAMIYDPEALANHVHPTSFLDACRRMLSRSSSHYKGTF